MNKILNHKNKVILIILGILILILSVFGLSYAYMSYIDKVSGAYTPFGSDSTTDVGDYINFIPGDPLSLTPGSDNLNILTGNLESTTSPRVELSSEGGFNETNYYTYFIIESNNFVYSSTDKKAEILLEITDNEGNVITEINGLDYVTSGGVTGFDITDKEDEFYINKTYIISDDGIVTSHDWNFTVTFVNLDSNQDVNYEKTFNAHIKMTHEVPKNNFEFTGDVQTFVATETGTYQIELWGAQGGSVSNETIGGMGSYTSGIINLDAGEYFSIYVGGEGGLSNYVNGTYNYESGGFNGGGIVGHYSINGGGGGSTDIRFSNQLESRFMVAAAGSGSTSYHTGKEGSPGGGLNGYAGSFVRDGGSYSYTSATGGSQLYYGIKAIGGSSRTNTDGGFGFGGNGDYQYAGAGGSGYYGGGGGGINSAVVGTGGSGSSFISGHTGSVAITSESNLTPKKAGEQLVDFPIRYIEVYSNGSNLNNYNHIQEISAYTEDGTNVALNKTVIGTVEPDYSDRPLSNFTNGNIADTVSMHVGSITVDLGQAYNLSEVNLWRYYADGRTYLETYVKVYNEDKTKSAYIHHYLIDGTYAETASGYTMDLSNSYNQPCYTGIINNSCSIHYSGKYFSNTVMIDGAGYNWTNIIGEQTPMPNPLGGYYPLGQGHTGNGYARITYIG